MCRVLFLSISRLTKPVSRALTAHKAATPRNPGSSVPKLPVRRMFPEILKSLSPTSSTDLPIIPRTSPKSGFQLTAHCPETSDFFGVFLDLPPHSPRHRVEQSAYLPPSTVGAETRCILPHELHDREDCRRQFLALAPGHKHQEDEQDRKTEHQNCHVIRVPFPITQHCLLVGSACGDHPCYPAEQTRQEPRA